MNSKLKKSFILIMMIFLVLILSSSAISAADSDIQSDSEISVVDSDILSVSADNDIQQTTDTQCIEEGQGTDLQSVENDEILSEADNGSYAALADKISPGGEIDLENDYAGASGDNPIAISQDTVINGNDYKIDTNGQQLFTVDAGVSLTLKDLVIMNTEAYTTYNKPVINNTGTLIFDNVTFTAVRTISSGGSSNLYQTILNTGEMTVTDSTFCDSTISIPSGSATTLKNIYVNGLIDNKGGNLNIQNTVFENNNLIATVTLGMAPRISPLILNEVSGTANIKNSTVRNNKVSYPITSSPRFEGLITNKGTSSLTIDDVIFENNDISVGSGSVANVKSLIFSEDGGAITVNNSQFKGNQYVGGSDSCGLITITNSSAIIERNVIYSDAIQAVSITSTPSFANISYNIFAGSSKAIASSFSGANVDNNYWNTNTPNFADLSNVVPNSFVILDITADDLTVGENTISVNLNKVNITEVIEEETVNSIKPLENGTLPDYTVSVASANLATTVDVTVEDGVGQYTYTPTAAGDDTLIVNGEEFAINVVSVVISADVSNIATEYANTVYAGTENVITATVSASASGSYLVSLYVDGVEVDNETVEFVDAALTVPLIDDTIRPVDASSEYADGVVNPTVNYTIKVFDGDVLIGENSVVVPVRYNGYLSKDLEYATGDEPYVLNTTINGGVLVSIDGAYTGAGVTTGEASFLMELDDDVVVKGLLYVPYTSDATASGFPVLNVTFNGNDVSDRIVGRYRDKTNLGTSVYGKKYYGVLIYDVSEFVVDGANSFSYVKVEGTDAAVYPAALVALYNTTGSTDYKDVVIFHGADLLSYSSNNTLHRPVNVTTEFDVSTDGVTGAELYVFGSGVRSGRGGVAFNGVTLGEDVWAGEDYNSVQYYYADVTGLLSGSNSISTVSTGSFTALQQMIVLTREVSEDVTADVTNLTTEYSNTAFAGTTNVVVANVTVNVAGSYLVSFYVDGEPVVNKTVEFTGVAQDIEFIDSLIRDIDASTAAGAENAKVNYTVKVFDGDDCIGEKSIIVPVRYNGYLGYDYEYNGTGLVDSYTTTINGDILIQVMGPTTKLSGGDLNRTDVWNVVLPDGSVITDSFLYMAYNWDKSSTPYPEFTLIFNGENIASRIIGMYRDQSNLGGASARYGYGLLIYNVTGLTKAGENTLVLNKTVNLTSVYPSTLITLYNTTGSASFKTVYFMDGADLLYNAYNKAGRAVESNNVIDVSVDGMTGADWYVLAGSANKGEADFKLNGEVFSDLWADVTNTYNFGVYHIDAASLIQSSNSVSFVSTNSTILALSQIVVVETPVPVSADVTNVTTEYSNTAFAGTTNVVVANVTVNVAGSYLVSFYVDGEPVVNKTVEFTGVAQDIEFIDSLIRDIDASTAAGAENAKVNYTVKVFDGDVCIGEKSIIVPVRYNGYLGYDNEFEGTGLVDSYTTTINGDILIQVMDPTTKLSGGDLNRTDVWNVALPANSEITDSFLYLAYNWDKSTTPYPEFTLMFNGEDIASRVIGMYRDQSNLGGASARYGYGLLIYNVTGLTKAGENTLVLNKTVNLTSVYPSTLITLYNTTGSTSIKNVYFNDGADLLYNAYNKAGRAVESNNVIAIPSGDLAKATWYVLAGSANKGEADFKLNDQVFNDLWADVSDTYNFGLYPIDATLLIKESNNVSFISTGGTILALSQIIVTEAITADNALDVNVPQGTDSPSFSIDLPADATGTLTVTVDGKNYTAQVKNGKATVNVPDLSSGSHSVSISYSGDEKYSPISKNTTVSISKPVISGSNLNVLYTSTKKFGVRVTLDGKAVVGKVVSFRFNGKTLTAKTDNNGYAYIKVSNVKPKSYSVVVSYKDAKVTKKVTVKSIIKAKNLKVKKSAKKLSIKVTLSKVDKKYLKGKKLTLKFRGKKYKAKTNKKGVATFTIKKSVLKKLKAGKKYKYTVTYGKNVVNKKITVRR